MVFDSNHAKIVAWFYPTWAKHKPFRKLLLFSAPATAGEREVSCLVYITYLREMVLNHCIQRCVLWLRPREAQKFFTRFAGVEYKSQVNVTCTYFWAECCELFEVWLNTPRAVKGAIFVTLKCAHIKSENQGVTSLNSTLNDYVNCLKSWWSQSISSAVLCKNNARDTNATISKYYMMKTHLYVWVRRLSAFLDNTFWFTYTSHSSEGFHGPFL